MLESDFSWADASWDQRVAYMFNRTALGIITIYGIWSLWTHDWWTAFLVFGILYPVYFGLWVYVDAP